MKRVHGLRRVFFLLENLNLNQFMERKKGKKCKESGKGRSSRSSSSVRTSQMAHALKLSCGQGCCCLGVMEVPTLCDPMNRSTPGLPVHHQLPEFSQTHVHRVSDAIQPSHPLSFPSPADLPNPRIESCLLHCRGILYQLSHLENPIYKCCPLKEGEYF